MNGLPPPVRAYLASIDALLTMTIDNLRNMTEAMKRKLEEEYGVVPVQQQQEDHDPPPTVQEEEEEKEPSFEPLFGSPPRPPSPPAPFYKRRLRQPTPPSSSSSSSSEEEEEDDDSEFKSSSSSSSAPASIDYEEDDEKDDEDEKKKRQRNPNAFVVSDDEEIERYSKETKRRHEEKRRSGIPRRKKAPKLEIEDEDENEGADPYEMEEDDSDQDNIDLFEKEGSHADDAVPVEDGQELASIMGWAKNYAPSGPWWDVQFGDAHNMVRDNLGLQGNNEEAQSYFDAIIKGCANKTASKLPHTKKVRELINQQEVCCFCNKKKPCRQVLVVPGLKEPGYIAACCAQLANAVIAFYKTFYECARNKVSPTKTFKRLRRLHGAILEAHAGKANFHRNKNKKKN